MNVINYRNINIEHINIQNPIWENNNYNFEINYNNNLLLIQTPKAKINFPQNLHFYNNYKYQKVSLCFENYKSNNLFKNFLDKFELIENKLLNASNFLWSKIDTNNNDKTRFIRSIRYFNNKAYINLNIQIHQNKPILPVFDRFKQPQTIDYILPQSESINIIYLKSIWQHNNKLGTHWILLQSKVYLPIIYIKECIIDENSTINNTLNIKNIDTKDDLDTDGSHSINDNKIPRQKDIIDTKDDPEKEKYKKFIKMHKFGVSKGAINIELQKLGLDYKVFLKLIGDKNDKEDFIDYNFDSRPVIKITKKKKDKKIEPKKKQQAVFRPPSQSQLQDMLSNLKKVKKKKN